MKGVLVCSIPFTHPGHVPQILVYLRQQALFNCLIASCVRPMARQDPDTTILEVSALSWQHISVSVEHPYEETIATAELDLTDISALKCRLYGVGMTTIAEQTSELSGRVLQRCLSIPLTMRILLKIWESNSLPAVMSNLTSGAGGNGNYNLNLGTGSKDQIGQNGTAPGMPDFTNGEPKIKQEPSLNNGNNGTMGNRQMQQQQQSSSSQLLQQQQQQSFLDAGTESSIGFPSYSGQSDTSTMGAVTSNTSASMLNPLQLSALLGQAKNSLAGNSNSNERGKKTRKRKSATDGLWRSPKRKCDNGDSTGTTEILLESSGSESSTPLGTPTSGRENFMSETRTSTPTSATSLASGIDYSNSDTTDILSTDKSTSDYDLDNSERDNEIMEVQHSGTEQQQQDMEELIKARESSSTRKSKKSRNSGGGSSGGGDEKKSSPMNIFVDETSTSSSNKTMPVPPSVSITPISCGNLDQTSATNYNSVLTGMGLERRPGIEIIPIASSPSQTNLPSSITITPIAAPAPSSKTSSLTNVTEERQRSERKSGGKSSGSKSGSEDNKSGGNKLEKRRKRKREDNPMGPPPDKISASGKQQQQQQQQDPLTKPVSVSIKPSAEQSSSSGAGGGLSCSSRPSSPAAVRKFSPSPTHTSSLATLVSKSSPTLKAGQSATISCGGKPVQSPKHSPVYGSSPKHNTSNVPIPMSVPMSLSVSTVPNTVGNVPSVAVSVPVPVPASASPKHGSTSSPKHGSSAASSGKPSMSALKSAANSPCSKSTCDATTTPSKVKSSSSSSSSKDSSGRGDKERRVSSVGSSGNSGSGHQSPKTKSSSSGKLKQLEMVSAGSGTETAQISSLHSSSNSGGNTPPSGQIDAASKSAIAAQQARNRKSSLNAVIDKLKNAQHCTESDTCGNGGNSAKSSSSSGVIGSTVGLNNSGSGNQKEKNIGGGNSSSSSSGKNIIEGGKSSCVAKNSSVDIKNPASEYMVKHSSDGIKITINKTRTKDSKQSAANLKMSSSSSSSSVSMIAATSSSSSSSSMVSGSSSSSVGVVVGNNGSPKTYTGLKPGVTSGPASKKPQTLQTAQKLLPGNKMLLASGGIKSAISSGATNASGGVSTTSAATVGVGGGNPLSKSGSSSKSSGSPKTSSSGATDLSRSRDKPRITKSGDKSVFSKGLADVRKSSPSGLREESDSERAFKLLAAHASISNLPPSLPPQLVMEGLMKQLDTNFQIPKLSARANVADAVDKNKSSDKLPMLPDSAKQTLDGLKQEPGKITGLSNISGSKPLSDDQSRREHAQTKPDNLSIAAGSTGAMSLNLSSENTGGLMLPPQSTVDSDIPTNLCIQSMMDNEPSRDSCKDLGTMRQTSASQQFSKIDDAGGGILSKGNIPDQLISSAKTYAPIASSGASASSSSSIIAESLNLSTKPADQAALQAKYKIVADEKKQQACGAPSSTSSSSTLFSSLGGVATSSDSNPGIVMTTDVGASNEQEVVAAAAAEILLDFSVTNKDSMAKGHSLPLTQHHLTTIPERVMTQAGLVVRRNTPPPPPPPPPPAPFPPVASPSVSVHIVKSPAPSPRVIPPSPHSSASPCITDDELMDEALVGLGK